MPNAGLTLLRVRRDMNWLAVGAVCLVAIAALPTMTHAQSCAGSTSP